MRAPGESNMATVVKDSTRWLTRIMSIWFMRACKPGTCGARALLTCGRTCRERTSVRSICEPSTSALLNSTEQDFATRICLAPISEVRISSGATCGTVPSWRATFQDAWLFHTRTSATPAFAEPTYRASNCAVVQFYEADLSEADLRSANLPYRDVRRHERRRGRFQWLPGSTASRRGIFAAQPKAQKAFGINDDGELAVTADSETLQVAQFVHLLLRNPQIREVLDTVTRKLVLILGRFTPDRKAVLDAVREHLQHYDLVPVVVDFDVPAQRNVTETVTLLAASRRVHRRRYHRTVESP